MILMSHLAREYLQHNKLISLRPTQPISHIRTEGIRGYGTSGGEDDLQV